MELTLRNEMSVSAEEDHHHVPKLTNRRNFFAFAVLTFVACAVLFNAVYAPQKQSTTEILQLNAALDNFKYVGKGGCSTDTPAGYKRQIVKKSSSTLEDCAKICIGDADCSAFEFAAGDCLMHLLIYQQPTTTTTPMRHRRRRAWRRRSARRREPPQQQQPQTTTTTTTTTRVCYARNKALDNFKYVGKGGCSTDTQAFARPVVKKSSNALEDCAKICISETDCSALEFAAGECSMHPLIQKITKSNNYPGVVCYAKEKTNFVQEHFKSMGLGGCGTQDQAFARPFTKSIVQTITDCAKTCMASNDCYGYEFVVGKGECFVHPKTSIITRSNNYPGVVCHVKKKPN